MMNGISKSMVSVLLGFLTLGAPLKADAQTVIDDPVAYWNFEDADNVLSNLVTSGSYHDGSVLFGQMQTGLAEGSAGIAGDALLLDGASAFRLPYHQENLGTSFTISMWY